jgi:hypothetical protein
MELKVITYEERMLEFFNKQLKFSKQKLERIKRKRFTKVVDRMTMLSDAGEEVSYYEKVIEMLEEMRNESKRVL